MRLFGPARSAAELLEEAERGAAPVAPALVLHVVVVEQRASRQQCLWSLLARLAKDASLAAADGNADGGSAAADDSDAASSSGSSTGMDSAAQHASLLNLLDQAELLEAPLPLALGGPTPPLLSARRAGPLADGIPVAGLLEPFGPTPLRRRPVQPRPPAQQQRARGAGVSPLALAAVDTVFVAACGVALVCAVLLVADIWCNGWRGGGDGPARGCSAYPAGCLVAGSKAAQQLTVPLLVVAAEEVEQAGGCGRRIY